MKPADSGGPLPAANACRPVTDNSPDDSGDAERGADAADRRAGDGGGRPRGEPDADVAFHEWLGLEMEEQEGGRAVVRIPYRDRITNPYGVPHGGVVATAADVASGAALLSDLPEGAYVTTTDLDVKYLEAAADDLVATAEVVRVGGSIGVVSIEVTSDTADGDPATVGLARATYRVYRPDE